MLNIIQTYNFIPPGFISQAHVIFFVFVVFTKFVSEKNNVDDS